MLKAFLLFLASVGVVFLLACSQPTPTPTPVPTPTPTPSPTPTSTPTPFPTATARPQISPIPKVTPTPVTTPTPVATPSLPTSLPPLAFTVHTAGYDVFVYDMQSKEILRLNLGSVDADHGIGYYSRFGLAWLPDSKTLVVAGYEKGVFLVDTVTGQSSPLTDSSGAPLEGWSPSFSPDGSKIAFCCEGGSGRSRLIIYDLASHQVTTIPGGLYPHWSSTNKLVYIRDAMYVFDVATQQEQKVPIPPYSSILDVKWSPDGTKLLYNAHRDNSWNIFVFDLKSGSDLRLTGDYGDQMASWSPTGTQIVWTRTTTEHPDGQQLYLMDADGSNKKRLLADDYNDSYGARWSPDGKKIAFVAPTGVDNSDILVFDFQQGLRNVTKQLDGRQADPSWSPDRNSLVFSGSKDKRFQEWHIYEVNLRSGTASTLITTPNASDWCPDWSLDGKEIAFSVQETPSREQRNMVLMLPSSVTQVVPWAGESNAVCGKWSPDVRYLALNPSGKQGTPIALLDISKGTSEIVADSAVNPAWATDPDKLYFVTFDGDLVRLSLTDKSKTVLVKTGSLDIRLRSFAVSPDGRYMVIVENLQPGVGLMTWGLFFYDTVNGTRRELIPGFSMYLISDVVWAK